MRKILVSGATGYIGGRLVPKLLEAGYPVRVFVRDPGRLMGRAWLEEVEVVQGDVFDSQSLAKAMDGVSAAYYLIHSMSQTPDFHQRDLIAAEAFGSAARLAGVDQIIYLGGLGDERGELSEHLMSRQETGNALRWAGVPVTEFRAAVIVGSGSISFEMIRYLTERVPIMVCPRWVFTKVQPIAIRDVLDYLTAALVVPEARGQIIEIGGSDVLTYGDMMMGYARVRGLRRTLLPVPFLTPNLSSYWVHWVTPVPAAIARPLIEGLKSEVIVRDPAAAKIFPDIQPVDYESAVERALGRLDANQVETSWSDSLFSSQQDVRPVELTTTDGMIIENRQAVVAAPPAEVFRAFTRLGGDRGYGYMDWAWRIRGMFDRIAGGVGFRRGRRHPVFIRVGDAIDFWRVEAVEPNKLMRLRAEMKVPGGAWLQYKSEALPDGGTLLHQTAFFAPKGLLGLLYWYLLYPVHALIFSGLITKIKEQAEREAGAKGQVQTTTL
ncbi:MAG: DUF2867 domain-containing protein [Anaerolineales bacterium]|nr:DUF2867 domain-containing protein [Anaerolineales bacterium]